MAIRKWLVRGLVCAAVGLLAVGAWGYRHWTDPETVRALVLARLAGAFSGSHVRLDSAQACLFGGITLTEVRLSRRDDLDLADFAYLPSVTLRHDKEQLLEGRLELRQVELRGPRLRIVRSADGRCNLQGVATTGPSTGARLPTIVLQKGIVVLEDRASPGQPPLEIRDISLTATNDPSDLVSFHGSGTIDVLGPVALRGSWRRDTGHVTLSVEAPTVTVGPALMGRLAAYAPETSSHLGQVEASLRVEADLRFTPGATPCLTHEVRCRVNSGRVRHPRLPLPLEDLGGTVRIVNAVVTRAALRARTGEARLELTAEDFAPLRGGSPADMIRQLDFKIHHLPIQGELFANLPEPLQGLADMNRLFSPRGTATIAVRFCRDAAGLLVRQSVVELEGLAMQFLPFPYPVKDVRGTLEQHAGRGPTADRVTMNLVGRGRDGPVYLKGEVLGQKPHQAFTLDLWSDDVALDDPALLAALPPRVRPVAVSFHPSGRASVKAFIRRGREDVRFTNQYVVTLLDGRVCFDHFPYPLERVSGVLEIRHDGWEVRDFRGERSGCEVRAAGRTRNDAKGCRLELGLSGTNVPLDDELYRALPQENWRHTWRMLQPSGRFNFSCTGTMPMPQVPPPGTVAAAEEEGPELTLVAATETPAPPNPPGTPPPSPLGKLDLDLTLEPQGCRIAPAFFRYPLDDVRGRLHYANHVVELTQFRAVHRRSAFSLGRGHIQSHNGGLYARLTDLRGGAVEPDAELLAALPPNVRKLAAALQVQDPFGLHVHELVVATSAPGAAPDLYWDGVLGFRGATLYTGVPWSDVHGQVSCKGRFDGSQLIGVVGNVWLTRATALGLPFEDMRGAFGVPRGSPDVVASDGISARLFGGHVGGPVRVEFGRDLRYDLKLTASQVKLEEFGRHLQLGPKAEIAGLAEGQLHLEGHGHDLGGLKGHGNLRVPSGKIYNLPLLLDLLKVLSGHAPDRTFFEEAESEFQVFGPRLHFTKLNLYGNAISLRGQGDVNMDGSNLNLDFNADWARVAQLLPSGVKRISSEISNQLLKIKMRGRLGRVECIREPVPIIVDPLRRAMGGAERGSP